MRSNNVKFSIYFKIILFVFVSVISSVIINLGFFYSSLQRESLTYVSERSKLNLSRLSFMLGKSLWDYDMDEIQKILDKELLERDIIYIKLSDFISKEKEVVLYEQIEMENGWRRAYRGKEDWDYLNQNTLFLFHDDIIYNKEKIGELSIRVSDVCVNEFIRNSFVKTTLNSLSFIVLLPFVLLLGIKILILEPLTSLSKVVKYFSRKDFTVRSPIRSNDEIGWLSDTFNAMADSIEEHSKNLEKQLYYDNLTGLPNRAKLIDDLKLVKKGLILLVNIDSFQEVNDFYGYEVGDSILIEITHRFKEVKSDLDVTIYRLQSDEFALLVVEDIKTTALFDEIRTIIGAFVFFVINDKVFICNESEISIRATVGVAKIHDSGNIKALYNADMALKKAKQLQKHYLVYDDTLEIAKEYENNIKWTFILKEAVSEERIVPFFQPIVNNQTGMIEKYECLCRIIGKNGDVISPYYFLDIAKKIRFYPYITKQIVMKSFEKFSELKYDFSINLSVVDILNDDTRKYIKSIIMSNQETAKRVVFELLESDGIQNYNVIKAFIENVKVFGCKIAIDDFGSGYSNFDHIISLDVDFLKIDASMIKNIDKERESQIVTKTIVNFSKELNIKTVSEYVHSLAVFQKVKELGVDYSQGYFFGEPMADIFSLNGK